MPVSLPTIKTQINNLVNQTKVLEQEQSQEAFVNGLATIIYNSILSATVTIPSGAIITTGSAVTQTNPGPAIGSLI